MLEEQPSITPVVLVVENDVILRLVTASNMRDAGFDVIEAANCAEATRILDCIPVDVLLSDLDMPGNIDGLALVKWVHRSQADTRIILTSAAMGHSAASRNTLLSSPSPPQTRMLSISCEAFFLHPRKEQQRGSLMSKHMPHCPPPVVLVVENDVLERVFKAAALRRQGLEVFEAADVAEAITVLKKIAVDLLISDISLVDGAVLAQLAKEHQPSTQIAWTLDRRQSSVETAVLH